jgi:site-specific DNA-methyltransferase (adenine-specific)
MCTDEGDIVLDPFVGTGTTAVAAKRLGRHFIAIDIDPKYVEMTKRKLERVYPTKIGDYYVSIFLGKVVTIRDKDWEKLRPYFKIPKDLQTQEATLHEEAFSEIPTLPFEETEEVEIAW